MSVNRARGNKPNLAVVDEIFFRGDVRLPLIELTKIFLTVRISSINLIPYRRQREASSVPRLVNKTGRYVIQIGSNARNINLRSNFSRIGIIESFSKLDSVIYDGHRSLRSRRPS